MIPKLTEDEFSQMQNLMGIIYDERRSIGERQIALTKFKQIYKEALKRTIWGQRLQSIHS
jgi:hypothetical protein